MQPSKPLRLGILVPSSNTSLEPLTQALIASLPTTTTTTTGGGGGGAASNPTSRPVTVHFSRFAVTSISLSPSAIQQFDPAPMLAAAQLLAHADVDVIGWGGTAAAWLGFERDAELCAAVTSATGGVPCTTSVVALQKALSLFGVRRLALVTPYVDDVQEAIIGNYRTVGVDIGLGMERHLGLSSNREIGLVGEEVLDGMVRDVLDGTGAEALTTFCTNWLAAQRVEIWEAKWGVPVFDTVSVVIWDMLRIGGFDVKSIKGWGSLFQK